MFILAICLFLFTFLQFSIALVNFIFNPKLHRRQPTGKPLVSILIPARNEAPNIGAILNDVMSQNYANIEIIVFDDESEDDTAEIVSALSHSDSRISLISSSGLPHGWLGKSHACYSLAEVAKGDFLLFLDADVRIGKDGISSALGYSQKYQLGLLSAFPAQIMITRGEKMTVPVMNFILLSLLPLPLVKNSRFSSLSAANGQFMLFDATAYHRLKPHERMKDAKVEDIKIARYFKQKNVSVACIAADHSIQCRMYHSFNEAIHGFSKNIVDFFGHSFMLGFIFWFITTLGFIPIVVACSLNFLMIYIVMFIFVRIFVLLTSHQRVFDGLIYMIPHQFSMGLMLVRSFINQFFNQYQWKGRDIS